MTTDVTVALGDGVFVGGHWPRPEAAAEPSAADTGVDVHRRVTKGSQRLGTLTVRLPPGRVPTPVEQRLLTEAAQHAALIVDSTRLDQALRGAVEEASARRIELDRSRQRIVGTIEDERRLIERDIHDGAQQHLVALVINLRLLRVVLERDPLRGADMASTVAAAAATAIATLGQLSHGMYPAELVESGPAAALRTVAAFQPVPMMIVDETEGQRWRPEVERAIYFGCIEALQNAAKHAEAQHLEVRLAATADLVTFQVIDDGRGFDQGRTSPGSGTVNMRDRLDSVGGDITISSALRTGTTVTGRIPVDGSRHLTVGDD
jgi:signal transduction histidine kinase